MYVDSYAKIFLILYPPLENSTTRIDIWGSSISSAIIVLFCLMESFLIYLFSILGIRKKAAENIQLDVLHPEFRLLKRSRSFDRSSWTLDNLHARTEGFSGKAKLFDEGIFSRLRFHSWEILFFFEIASVVKTLQANFKKFLELTSLMFLPANPFQAPSRAYV